MKIPGSVIALAEKKGGGETQFDFIGNMMDERKSVVGNVRDFIKVKLAASEAEKLARRNFHYDAGFTLAPGRYRMRFLVRENQSGKMGTFDYPLHGPRPGRRFHGPEDQLGHLEQPARAGESRGGRGRKDPSARSPRPIR